MVCKFQLVSFAVCIKYKLRVKSQLLLDIRHYESTGWSCSVCTWLTHGKFEKVDTKQIRVQKGGTDNETPIREALQFSFKPSCLLHKRASSGTELQLHDGIPVF